MKRLIIFVLALFLITGCIAHDNPSVTDPDNNENLIIKRVINEIQLPKGYHKDRVEVFYIDDQYIYVSLYFEEHYERYYRVDRNNNMELLYEFYLGDNGDEAYPEFINVTGSYIIDNKLYLCYWNTDDSTFKIAYVEGDKLIDIYQSPKSIKGLYVKYMSEDYAVLQEITSVTVKEDNTVGKEYIRLLDLKTNKITSLLNLTRQSSIKTGEVTGENLTHFYQQDDNGFFYTISNDDIGNRNYYYDILNKTSIEMNERLYDQYFGTLDTTIAVNRTAESVPNIAITINDEVNEKYMLYDVDNLILEKVFFIDDLIYMCSYHSLIIYDTNVREYLEYDNAGRIQVYNHNIYSVVESNSNDYDLKIEKIELKEQLKSNKENLSELISKLKVYNNGYSDKDYTDEELCNHPRGEYVKDSIKIELWSEPHIHNTYYFIISEDGYSTKMYFSPDDYENIQKILEEYGYERLPE